MQLQIDEQGRILGCAIVGGYPDGVEVDFGTEKIPEFAPGKYLWKDGDIAENPDYIPPVPPEPERDPFETLRETVDMLVIQMLGGK